MSQKIKVKLPKLYDKQLEVAKACLLSDHKYITLNGGRQVGKTFLLTLIAFYWANQKKNTEVMIISPTDSQVKKIYKQMIELLQPVIKTMVSSHKQQSGDCEIVLYNRSIIRFRSALGGDSIRGYSNNYVLCDEAAFFKEDTWEGKIAPTLAAKGKKVLFCSTPKGSNFFHRWYFNGLEGAPGHVSFKITYKDNPYANKEFIMEQRNTIPEELFNQEYLGEFIDSTGVFKYVDELCILNKEIPDASKKLQYFQGWDIAFKNDYCVGVTIDSNGNMVDMERFTNVDAPQMRQRIAESVKKWNPRKVLIENNNQGLPIIQDLRNERVPNIDEFNTNASSKPDLINQLIAACSKREIKLLNDENIKIEFKAFCAVLSKTGKVQFQASYGHDDIVIATALAWECMNRNKYKAAFTLR